MEKTRYFLGVLFVCSVPPAVFFWLLIHPLIKYWRRLGPRLTYLLVGGTCTVLVVFLFRSRATLFGADLGTDWILVAVGCVLYGASVWLSLLIRRHLDLKTFTGLPEIVSDSAGGTLLQDGPYGRVRHPRYLAVILGTGGFALVVNYLGVYLVLLVSILALLLVVPLEERELMERFGEDYRSYRNRVPALIPRLRGKASGTSP